MIAKEKKMEVILWGLGTNGKNLIDVVDKGTVVAIIDTKAEVLNLKSYQEIPIIDFNTYLSQYKEYFIIVTPMICESIVKSLEDNFIEDYFLQSKSCMALSAFLEVKHDTFINSYKLNANNHYYIYGIDFFSLYLYKYLIHNDFKVDFLYADKKQKLMLERLNKKKIIDKFSSITKIEENDFIIQIQESSFVYDRFLNILDYKSLNEKFYSKWKTNLRKFKDSQSGKRIFIIATGPSLKISDLDMLQKNNVLTMSMNQIYHAFEKTNWRPNYYVISDGFAMRDYEKLKEKGRWFKNTEKIFSDNYLKFWNNQLDDSYHCFRQMQSSPEIGFSSDISDVVYSGLTVVYSCLQLATYMGFKEIYLLGCDFSFSPQFDSDKDHFYGSHESVLTGGYTFNYKFVQRAYEKAKEYSELHGLSIYNATRGGKLEVFKRVMFDDLFLDRKE